MSVSPLEQQTRHYGTLYSMADYKTNTINLFLHTSYQVSPQMTLFSTLSYNKSTGKLDEVVMDLDTTRLWNEVRGIYDLQHQNFDFSEMNEYAKMDYGLLGISLGFDYRISPRVTLSADGQYYDLKDDNEDGYVYGNETGSYFVVRAGVGYQF